METTTLKENNELIAEFMGYRLARCNNGLAWEYTLSKKAIDDKFNLHGRLYRPDDKKLDQFKTDWRWLMMVVEKIDQHGASVIIGRFFCEIKYINPLDESKAFDVRMASGVKINAINGAVIEFIKWHNEQ